MRQDLNKLIRQLDYTFNDNGQLELALVHRSASSDNNERLEFLGDAVLNMVVAQELYVRHPQILEGDLSRLRAAMVREEALAEVARRVELGQYLTLGIGELRSGGNLRDSILADALEAVIGAAFIDGGYDGAAALVNHLFKDQLESEPDLDALKDPKTRLQEWLQARQKKLPEYEIVETSGVAHKKRFVVGCRVCLFDDLVTGSGTSRRKAEQSAAQAVMTRINSSGYA